MERFDFTISAISDTIHRARIKKVLCKSELEREYYEDKIKDLEDGIRTLKAKKVTED